MREILFTVPSGVALQQNSAYKELIDEASLWIAESGIMSKIKERWLPGYIIQERWESKSDNNKQTALAIKHTTGIFYAIAIGCLISSIVFVLEWVFNNAARNSLRIYLQQLRRKNQSN